MDACQPFLRARHFGVASTVAPSAATIMVGPYTAPSAPAVSMAVPVSMVVGAGRFHHQLEISRPTAFAVGRLSFSRSLWKSRNPSGSSGTPKQATSAG
jgi:hypothetical protein